MIRQALYRHFVMPAFETVYKRRKTFSYWRSLEESQWLDSTSLADKQLQSLRKLLPHAYQSTLYYHQLFDSIGLNPSRIESVSDIGRIPLLTKSIIRSQRNALRTVDRSRRLITKTTGGSTGEPLQFDLDFGSHERRVAAAMRGYAWSGATPGTKQFHLWGVPLTNDSSARRCKDHLYNVLQRKKVVNSFTLNAESFSRILSQLNRHRPDVIVAYTSAIDTFSRDLAKSGRSVWSPKSIIVGAEKLHSFQRDRIESVFQAPVYETYGSREFMLIGAECSHRSGLHLTTDQLVVEILDEDGTPTKEGQVGNVVVTDLFNYGMPFIRYVTGDQAIAGFEQCTCGRGLPLLREVKGRQLDVVQSPDGRKTPGEFFPHLLKDFQSIRKFQVVQRTPSRLELNVVIDGSWSDNDEGLLLKQLQDRLGPEMNIDCVRQKSIPLTRFGKHRVVVNQCSPPTISQTLV